MGAATLFFYRKPKASLVSERTQKRDKREDDTATIKAPHIKTLVTVNDFVL